MPRRLEFLKRWQTVLVASCLLSGSTVQAASNYSEGFDAGDANGWIQGTSSSTVIRDAGVGNPAGSLVLRRDLSPPVFDLSTTSELPAVSGDYTGSPSWQFSFDTRNDIGKYNDMWLRFRYKDSTFNGWHLDVADSFPNDVFQSHVIVFDSNWTDAQAAAAGWQDETGGTVSWQQLMSDVFHPEIRFVMGDSESAISHVDNIQLRAVPEPTTFSLVTLGGIAAFFARRRRID